MVQLNGRFLKLDFEWFTKWAYLPKKLLLVYLEILKECMRIWTLPCGV